MYELTCYENVALAKRYADRVLATAAKDRSDWDYQATRAVLKYAFKVMAIKDEVYVAHLLTSPDKRRRDEARFRINPDQGDRLVYKHINRPEFVLRGRQVRWTMTTRDWQLRLMRRLKFLRGWLPDWHREEQVFRDWYLALVDAFEAETEEDYQVWVQILRCPEAVRGYREFRQPAMEEARKNVRDWLRRLPGHRFSYRDEKFHASIPK
jgi:indolepyruvate ferredoxin oxidoreductase